MAGKRKQPQTQPKNAMDRAKAKQAKQKRLAIILGGLLLLILVYEVPHTMKLMKHAPKAVVVSAPGTAPAATPVLTTAIPGGPPSRSADQTSAAAEPSIVASVQVTPDPGQLTEFTKFASKDPFNASVQPRPGSGVTSGTAGSGSTPSGTGGAGSAPTAPPAPSPTSAVISLNGELLTVSVGTAFPVSGTTFDRVGSLFQLVSLTAKSAKVSIVGGSYADGSASLTLEVGTPVTLQNTADGTKYTLILEPPGTPVTSSTSGTAPPALTPTTTTTSTTSAVPPAP